MASTLSGASRSKAARPRQRASCVGGDPLSRRRSCYTSLSELDQQQIHELVETDSVHRPGGWQGQTRPVAIFIPTSLVLLRFALDSFTVYLRADAQEYYGEPEQSGDLGLLYASGSKITARPISHPFETQSSPSKSSKPLTVDRLLSPLAPRDVTAIRGLGLQYAPDPTQKAASPPVLCLFFKPSTCISGPGDVIPLPELATEEKNDYEVELCVVIGKAAKDVRAEDAMSHVAG